MLTSVLSFAKGDDPMAMAPASMMLRQVAGNIASNGNPAHQVGEFTCKRVGAGHYQIKLQNPFTEIISVVGAVYIPGTTGNVLCSVVIENFSEDSINLFTVDSNGRSTDQAFTFIALGHQREQ
jgi:hypothetical protein